MFGISRKRMIWLCRSMATMLDAGLPVSRILTVLSGQSSGGRLPAALDAARRRVEGGATLAEALRAQGGFPSLFLQLVEAGEASGTLERALRELTRYFEFQHRMWRRFLARIAYPAFQYIAAVAIIAFVTYILATLTDAEGSALWVLLIGYGTPVALIALYVFAVRVLGASRPCHEVILRLPVVGKVMEALALARFSLVMYLLSEAAVPVKQALARSLEATGNGAFAARAERAVAAIEDSGNLTDALRATGLFPAQYLDIISVAEESGKTTERLDWLASHYADRSEAALGALVTAIAVLIWVTVAGIIIYFIFTIFMGYIGALNRAVG